VSEACAERPAAPVAGSRAGRGGPRRRIQLPHQIHELDSGGREAMHLAELLATAGGLDHDHSERTAAPPPRTAKAAALAGTADALAGAAAIAGGVAAAAR
jgi:hypothetical protein